MMSGKRPIGDQKSPVEGFKKPRMSTSPIIEKSSALPKFKLASDKEIQLGEIGRRKLLELMEEFELDVEDYVVEPINKTDKTDESIKDNSYECDELNSEDDRFLSSMDLSSIISESLQ